MNSLIENKELLFNGFITTLIITFFSVIFGASLGLVLMITSLKGGILSKLVNLYIYIIRGIPLLILILGSYLIAAPFFKLFSFLTDFRIICAIFTISFFASAYFSEILKSNFNFINKDQITSANSFGLSKYLIYKDIVFPQIIRKAKNPLIKQSITLFNESSLIYIIGVNDFFGVSVKIGEKSGNVVSSLLFITVVYLAISFVYQKIILRNKA